MAKPKGGKKGKKKKKLSTEAQLAELQAQEELRWKQEQERLAQQKERDIREFNLRSIMLGDTLKNYKNLQNEVYKLKSAEKVNSEWLKFLECSKLPLAFKPQKIRDFLHTMIFSGSKERESQLDFRLNANEYCLLTQDTRVANISRQKLKEQHKNIGVGCAESVKALLQILADLELVLKNATEFKAETIDDLETLKQEIRQLIDAHLEDFAFRVFSNIESEMRNIGSVASDHEFRSTIFHSHLWTFRGVPLPPINTTEKCKILLDNVNMIIKVPHAVELNEASLIGFWLHYDHISDTLENYQMPTKSVKDLLFISKMEFERRQQLADQRLSEMTLDRQEYEDKIKQQVLLDEIVALEKSSKKDKNSTKEKKKKKPKKKTKKTEKIALEIPPIVDENTIADVEKEFLAEEDQLYEKMKYDLGPLSLSLEDYEVNLRKYQISGGIFNLKCVEKPAQPTELGKNFLMATIKHPKKIKYKKFYQSYEPNPLALDWALNTNSAVSIPDVEEMRRTSQETEEIDPEKATAIEENEKKLHQLIHVTLKLPEDVFWWEEPIVCCWEPWTDSLEFHALDPVMQDYQLHYEKYEKEKLAKLFSAPPIPLNRHQLTTLEDFLLSDVPKSLDLCNLIRVHILPRLPANHKFHMELIAEVEQMKKLKKKQEQLKREATAGLDSDMNLKGSLNSETTSRFSDISKLRKSAKLKTDRTQLSSAPRNLFPKPSFVPRLQITNQIGELEAVDDSAEEAAVAFSKFIKSLIPMRDTEKPYFRNYSQIALYEENENFEDQTEFLELNERSNVGSAVSLEEPRRVTGSNLIQKQEKESSSFSVKAEQESNQDGSELITGDEPNRIKHQKLELIPHAAGKWTHQRNVHVQSYDAANRTISFYLSTFCSFGLATNKYSNFPLKHWRLYPNPNQKDSVLLKLVGQFATVEITIASDGFKLNVLEPKNTFFKPMLKSLKLEEFINFAKQINLNLFPEDDAICYVEDVSVKNASLEDHTYQCMANYCLTHNFAGSVWNKLAHRRVICLKLCPNDCETPLLDVMVDMHRAIFTEIQELCTPLDEVQLIYLEKPQNQKYNADLHHLLLPDHTWTTSRIAKSTPMLLRFNVSNLLQRIRPLSYS